MYRKILVPLDGSETAEEALPHAQELSGRLGVDLAMLSVCSSQDPDSISGLTTYVEQKAVHVQRWAREIQEEKGSGHRDALVKTYGIVVVGEPVDGIVNYCEQHGIDLIVMTHHGKSGLKDLVLGGVADRIIRAGHIPIQLIPNRTD